jgi:DNA repair protein RecO (recombination protein O)
MNQIVTRGIVLARTNFQEADRIMTVLTPDQGKVRVIAKGVRKPKSRLAGGVELFSISDITFIPGKGEINTLISARLMEHYGNIATDIERTMLGYELIKLLNKAIEDAADESYFELLKGTLESLNNATIEPNLIKLWFYAQLLRYAGHTPNLYKEQGGNQLDLNKKYRFDYDNMAFLSHPEGSFNPDHIKFLRLVFSGNKPGVLQKVRDSEQIVAGNLNLLQTILPNHIRT